MRQPTLPSRLLCDPDKRRQLAYKPAAATDIRATFRRVRAQQAKAADVAVESEAAIPAPVTWLRRSKGA
jgi:hypothetical protein